MGDHHQTAIEAIKNQLIDLLKPSSFGINHRLASINDLSGLVDNYHLIILDRDCSLQSYHGKERVPEFEDVLQLISPKSELVSNSSYKELLRIRDIFGELMPISKLVKFSQGGDSPYLLRFVDGELTIWKYDADNNTFTDETSKFKGPGDNLLDRISYSFKKPNPLILTSVIDINIQQRGITSEEPRVLMVGDRYLTDMVAGNLAGVDTAKVKPYKPLSDKFDLILARYMLDAPFGYIMSQLAKSKI